ncbi:hypothetical protein B7L88_gp061 [Rhizobium phage RHEph10]|uniref:hypothetical protein n=1 Tax=Rhizobium phage RHEph10 TaxID=1220717 RepID=UPI0002AB28E9|nr:hypothetical protein B7L88_gp061 [Rhizobium phage RHEph10]AGC36105.1 hypothetical protein RHEph10_gp061 [Rhizobium phage RHEph10]
MELKEHLIAARALIADEGDWGQGEDRCRACALDALRIEEDMTDDDPRAIKATEALRLALPASFTDDPNNWNHPVAQFNDRSETRHADVLALYDRAIEMAGV